MARLSLPIEQLKSHYTVVVIGSGYGGSITASRMARAVAPDNQKITVCVLERGKEFQPRDLDQNGQIIKPGEYPDTEFEALRQVQVDTPLFHAGSRTGLYGVRMNKEIDVFIGCGLGGTSLVNANVCAEAALPHASRVTPASVNDLAGHKRWRNCPTLGCDAALRPFHRRSDRGALVQTSSDDRSEANLMRRTSRQTSMRKSPTEGCRCNGD